MWRSMTDTGIPPWRRIAMTSVRWRKDDDEHLVIGYRPYGFRFGAFCFFGAAIWVVVGIAMKGADGLSLLAMAAIGFLHLLFGFLLMLISRNRIVMAGNNLRIGYFGSWIPRDSIKEFDLDVRSIGGLYPRKEIDLLARLQGQRPRRLIRVYSVDPSDLEDLMKELGSWLARPAPTRGARSRPEVRPEVPPT